KIHFKKGGRAEGKTKSDTAKTTHSNVVIHNRRRTSAIGFTDKTDSENIGNAPSCCVSILINRFLLSILSILP
ncbi:hypothetical protein, partial [Citrobacter freundii]|uniref:hypothetical protein n=1 Tax=Citrobacter freundii TaxID=546 RepID=UPI00383AECE0